jgi:ABC-2 type transport system permease protein
LPAVHCSRSAGGLSPLGSIIGLLIICIVGFAGGLFLFDRTLKLARRLGILSV